MNLFLTNACNERCSFCYARDWFKGTAGPAAPLEPILEALEAYAALVAKAPPLPPWDAALDELTQTYFASRCVNLLGGEPCLHPHFETVVKAITKLGLGVIVFTNGSRPDRIRAVANDLWTVTINGHFAHRAPGLGLDIGRVFANLPVAPGDDIRGLLQGIADAAIKGIFLAFATPAGGNDSRWFTPDDVDEMRRLHGLALAFCEQHGIFMGYDCSFPLCVDERVAQTRCSSVPVMDVRGEIAICGGEYYQTGASSGPGRHISSFASLEALHSWTFGLHSGLRQAPSQFEVCNQCAHFSGPSSAPPEERTNRCHGMCLAFRVKSERAPVGG